MTENPRKIKALTIVEQPDSIRQIKAHTFKVKSQSGNGGYVVTNGNGRYDCSCPDYVYRHYKIGYCKHILAVKLKEQIKEDRVIQPITVSD